MLSSNEQNRIILTNISKMLLNRETINKKIYNDFNKKLDDLLKDKNQLYTIDTKDNKKISIKIDKSNDRVILNKEFLNLDIFTSEKHKDNYKIIVVFNSSKAKKKENVEIFEKDELLVNIVDHALVPKHILLSNEEKLHMMNTRNILEENFQIIKKDDVISRYYNAQEGNLFKIIRKLRNGNIDINYRIVVDD